MEVDEGVSFAGDDGTLLLFPQAAPGALRFGREGSVLPLRAITDRNGTTSSSSATMSRR
ncbi:hypothetical protein [Amycolatopsis sp. NPDC004079]|uniref:hypothetical protein n=1 Tax=Amycolatopsis sp. NPDC004079 TaxID=3154549 RepID=UPI0033A2EDEF